MPSLPLSHRITWIDYAKAFSIIAVVLFHTNIPHIKSLAYILCLPAFFFISGLFIERSASAHIFLKKKMYTNTHSICDFRHIKLAGMVIDWPKIRI